MVATALVSMLLLALSTQAGWAEALTGAVPGGLAERTEVVTGAAAAPGLVQVALAGAAAAAFAAFADGLLRRLAGVVVAATGGIALALVFSVLASGTALGVAPWLGAVCALVGTLAGLGILASAGRWARTSARFAAPGVQDPAARRRTDAVSDWDRISRGDDPTA